MDLKTFPLNFFDKQLKELDELDTECDYFDFEDQTAKDLFVDFCKKKDVKYQITDRYSSETDSRINTGKVKFGAFDLAVIHDFPELAGNFSSKLTIEFMNSILDPSSKM